MDKERTKIVLVKSPGRAYLTNDYFVTAPILEPTVLTISSIQRLISQDFVTYEILNNGTELRLDKYNYWKDNNGTLPPPIIPPVPEKQKAICGTFRINDRLVCE